MPDFLDVLIQGAKATIESGYYEHPAKTAAPRVSLRKAILQSQVVPVIAEVKGASPSKGVIKENFDVEETALAMARGGAVGISVLTEPKHFKGSLFNLAKVRKSVYLPILMKDIIISPVQVDAAAGIGANAVLLIQTVYDRGCGELELNEMIEEAHLRELEVLLEVHDEDEFQRAVTSEADLVGINNRNLATLEVDLNTTRKILERNHVTSKLVVTESGISIPDDICFLRGSGADAFLIGSAIMSADDVESKVREFTMAQPMKKQE